MYNRTSEISRRCSGSGQCLGNHLGHRLGLPALARARALQRKNQTEQHSTAQQHISPILLLIEPDACKQVTFKAQGDQARSVVKENACSWERCRRQGGRVLRSCPEVSSRAAKYLRPNMKRTSDVPLPHDGRWVPNFGARSSSLLCSGFSRFLPKRGVVRRCT